MVAALPRRLVDYEREAMISAAAPDACFRFDWGDQGLGASGKVCVYVCVWSMYGVCWVWTANLLAAQQAYPMSRKPFSVCRVCLELRLVMEGGGGGLN
jgi:hypothetical protein